MPDLEQSIREWRQTMTAAVRGECEGLDELESHLRETVDRLVESGLTGDEAFQRAITQLGTPAGLASEFEKLTRTTWLPVKLAAGSLALTALLLPVLILFGSDHFRPNPLLATHVILATLGYLSGFLAGGLGICFVCQRSLGDFPSSRLQSIRRASRMFSGLAAGLTATAVILGAIWAKAAWGRYWAWDPRETGGFCVVVWMIVPVIADRFGRLSVRSLMVASILGNVVVGLAWFAPNLLLGVHRSGAPDSWWVLLAASALNVAFMGIGFAPAGWLRHQQQRA